MNEARLRVLFRRALALSLATPLAAAGASCGGGIETGLFGESPPPTTTGTATTGPTDATTPPPPPPRDGGRDALRDRAAAEDARGDAPACGEEVDVPDVNNGCEYYRPVPCDLPEDAGWLTQQQCRAICDKDSGPNGSWGCYVTTVGSQRVVACQTCVIGRRPDGLADDVMLDGCCGALGRFFADVARLEAASVDAFAILRDELAAHGAPPSLLRRAERARRDELRHAEMTGRVARRFGGTPRRARVARRAVRSLEEIALENAVEGCVRETFGALTAEAQARRARDPKIAEMMRAIARDETRHAALSWAVAKWIRPRLDAAAQARVDRAMRAAVHALGEELRARLPRDVEREAGMPAPWEARAMWSSLVETLWS
jgi:hypothetical protein